VPDDVQIERLGACAREIGAAHAVARRWLATLSAPTAVQLAQSIMRGILAPVRTGVDQQGAMAAP